MIYTAHADGRFEIGEKTIRCILGKSGVIPAHDKREGDGASPAGVWPIRRLLYRPDKSPPPRTGLPVHPIQPNEGWCDAPDSPAYNRPVRLPFDASHERLWRDDEVYDLVLVLGHNDDPVVPGVGSAIFLHLTRPDHGPTEGCVALDRPDLLALLARARPGDAVEIRL